MTSNKQKITYLAIRERAQSVALEYMPELPKQNTHDAWESFQHDVDALDAYEIAHESSEWDWVIYYHSALELCQSVPSGILHEAESEWEDFGGFEVMQGASVGLYEMATQLASLIVVREIAEAVEQAKEELIDLAETQMESL